MPFVVLVAFLFSFCCFSLVSNVQKRLTGFAVLKLIFYKAFLRADGERSEPCETGKRSKPISWTSGLLNSWALAHWSVGFLVSWALGLCSGVGACTRVEKTLGVRILCQNS